MEIKDYIIPETSSVLEAMALINENGMGIAYICDKKILKGVVTDGNIRRHILRNGALDVSVVEVANHTPKVLRQGYDGDAVEFMRQNDITSVPILNDHGEVITIKFLNAKPVYGSTHLNVPVVIMAGGKGTRLQPYTQVLPKPLIPIGKQTITELIADKFKDFGCNQFELIINYKKALIKTYFTEEKNEYNMSFIEEKNFLGTGGGLKLLKDKYDSTFFVTNCDILIEADYGDMLFQHVKNNRIITIVCAVKNITIPYGTVELDSYGRVKNMLEKPSSTYKVNTGLYIVEPKFLDYIPSDTFIHITDVIQCCIDAGENVGIYPIAENNWWDMGQITELEKMKDYIEKSR